MNLHKEHLRSVYQSHGIVFRDGNVILGLGAHGTLAIDEDIFLEPSEESVSVLKESIAGAIGIEYEMFDATDKQFETEVADTWYKTLGRVYHHEEWVCCPLRQRKYYTYLTLSAPMSEVSPDSWEKMALYLTCVIATLGILVVLGMITSGMSVGASVAIFSAVAASCLTVLAAVTQQEKAAAIIRTHIGYRGAPGPAPTFKIFIHALNGDFHQAHRDEIINYIDHSGNKWTAKIEGNSFRHAPDNDFDHPATHTAQIINYIDWSHNKWTAKIEGNSFLHAPDNNFNHPDTHPDEIINYIDWSHNKWTAKIQYV